MKLPSSPEIKRVIAAVRSAGFEVGSVAINVDGIVITTSASTQQPQLTAYEKWAMRDSA